MSRQIKFRVWDDQRKQFRDDAISFQTEENNIVEVSFENGEDHFIKKDGFISYPSSQIQQFTGFHDNNGKEIYEGDILANKNSIPENIVFKDGCFCFYAEQTGVSRLSNDRCKRLEIIGNIFENADLLKL